MFLDFVSVRRDNFQSFLSPFPLPSSVGWEFGASRPQGASAGGEGANSPQNGLPVIKGRFFGAIVNFCLHPNLKI